MDQMPIRGEAVRARILAHGRNNDSVAQRHFTDLKLVEQMHWDIPLRLDRRGRGPSILSFAPEPAIHSARDIITSMGTARLRVQTLETRIEDAEEGFAWSVVRL